MANDQSKNRGHDEVKRMFDRWVLPPWRHRPVSSITRADCRSVVDGIVARGTFTHARRVHGAMHRVDTSGGNKTINLPASNLGNVGQAIIGVKIGADANQVIMNPNGADTITGAALTAVANGSIHLVDNGDGTWTNIHAGA